jgi:hypothetical protein
MRTTANATTYLRKGTRQRGRGDSVSPLAGRRRPNDKDGRHGNIIGRRANKFVTMTL